MVLLSEEVKERVSLAKTPSDHLLFRMDLKLKCAEVLSFVEWAWYSREDAETSKFFHTFKDVDNARYWILDKYGIDMNSDEGEDVIGMAYNIVAPHL